MNFSTLFMTTNFSQTVFLYYNSETLNRTSVSLSSMTTASVMLGEEATDAVGRGYNIFYNASDTSQRDGKQGPPWGMPNEDSPSQIVSKHFMDKVSCILIMVMIPCFSVFGSVGNVLSLRVLVHHRMRNATNMVLAALAVSDLLFLLHAVYFSFLKIYALRNPAAGDHLRAMTFPLLGAYGSVVTARITTGLTTMLSVERLVAVYFPMKAKVMCGKFMTVTCIVLIYLVTAVVFIPNALKYHSYYKTVNNQTVYFMGRSELGKNTLFYFIYGNVLNVLFRFIPLLVLILVNILIALAIRRTWSFRRTMSSGGSAQYEQNRITLMLLMVSLVFLICILPGAIHSIMNQIYKQYSRFGAQSNIYDVFGNITYFLETVNSSVNFFIYMAFSKKFCRTYKQIFCCMRQRSISRSSARSIIRFSSRPQNGSRSSMTSYRELHFLNQLGMGKNSSLRDREANGKPVRKNGFVANTGTILEEGGKKIFRSKYSISESYSGHSHSHSHSGHSSQGKGERFSQHSLHSVHSVHSNHSSEPTAAEMYS